MVFSKPIGDANPHHSGFVRAAVHQAVSSIVEMGSPTGGVEYIGGRQRNYQFVKENVADFEVQIVAERGGELRVELGRDDVIIRLKPQPIAVTMYWTIAKFQ